MVNARLISSTMFEIATEKSSLRLALMDLVQLVIMLETMVKRLEEVRYYIIRYIFLFSQWEERLMLLNTLKCYA